MAADLKSVRDVVIPSSQEVKSLFEKIAGEIRKGDGEGVGLLSQLYARKDAPVKKGHPVLSFQDEFGRNLIHIAAKYHRDRTLEYLVQVLWVDPFLKCGKQKCIPSDYNQPSTPSDPSYLRSHIDAIHLRLSLLLSFYGEHRGQVKLYFERLANAIRDEENAHETLLTLSGVNAKLKQDVLSYRDEFGRNLIHIAAKYLRFRCVNTLITHFGVDHNLKSERINDRNPAKTPLEFAVKTKSKLTDADKAKLVDFQDIQALCLRLDQLHSGNQNGAAGVQRGNAGNGGDVGAVRDVRDAGALMPAQHLHRDHLAEVKQSQEGSWLFKVRNSKENVEFHLLGTCHVVPLSQQPPFVTQVVKDSFYLLSETENKNPIDELIQIVKKFDGHDLNSSYNKFDDETKRIIETELKDVLGGALLNLAKKLKPWLIVGVLYILKMGNLQRQAMDSEVVRLIEVKGGMILGLEDYSDKIKTYKLDTLTLSECEQKIKEFSRSLTRSRVIMNEAETLTAYKSGDLKRLADIEQSDIEPRVGHAAAVLRNQLWMVKLPLILGSLKRHPHPTVRDPKTLVAVGAAHLVGESGLLYQLARQGYTVERYNNAGRLMPFDAQALVKPKNRV